LGKFVGVMSGLSLGTRVSNLKSVALTVLGLLASNSHDRPLRTHGQTETHTSNEHIISAIHFVHLAEIMITLTRNSQPEKKDLALHWTYKSSRWMRNREEGLRNPIKGFGQKRDELNQ